MPIEESNRSVKRVFDVTLLDTRSAYSFAKEVLQFSNRLGLMFRSRSRNISNEYLSMQNSLVEPGLVRLIMAKVVRTKIAGICSDEVGCDVVRSSCEPLIGRNEIRCSTLFRLLFR